MRSIHTEQFQSAFPHLPRLAWHFVEQAMDVRRQGQVFVRHFDLQSHASTHNDPARGYVCRKSGARVGFITSMSDHFCDSCNRMRLTAEGGLRPCLHQDAEVDVRAVLRKGGSDDEIARAFQQAAGLKWAGHKMTSAIPLYSSKEMVAIGG